MNLQVKQKSETFAQRLNHFRGWGGGGKKGLLLRSLHLNSFIADIVPSRQFSRNFELLEAMCPNDISRLYESNRIDGLCTWWLPSPNSNAEIALKRPNRFQKRFALLFAPWDPLSPGPLEKQHFVIFPA